MPQGLQVFRSDGSLAVDLTDRITRVIGIRSISAGVAGSQVVNTAYGTPWGIILPNTSTYAPYEAVTIVGDTISWNAGGARTLVYGVY